MVFAGLGPDGGQREGFAALLRWETRTLRGRKGWAWLVVLGLAWISAVLIAWHFASEPVERHDGTWEIFTGLSAGLIATPPHDSVAQLGQMTSGYNLLRILIYAGILLPHLFLPALASGSISQDRLTGRMADLQVTPVAARTVYLAKALAFALPFLAPVLLIPLLCAGILTLEAVPVLDVLRLLLELIGQVLLTVFVTLTCSALFAHPWSGRFFAFLLTWVVLPALWIGLLFVLREESVVSWWLPHLGTGSFSITLLGNVVFTIVVGLFFYWLGVRNLRKHGLGRPERLPYPGA